MDIKPMEEEMGERARGSVSGGSILDLLDSVVRLNKNRQSLRTDRLGEKTPSSNKSPQVIEHFRDGVLKHHPSSQIPAEVDLTPVSLPGSVRSPDPIIHPKTIWKRPPDLAKEWILLKYNAVSTSQWERFADRQPIFPYIEFPDIDMRFLYHCQVAGIELDATGAEEELSLLLSCVDLDHGNAGRKKNKNGFTRQCMVKGLEIAL
ncbi:hypothetical protein GWI33_016105 [Rhynchophorus ferrugineus]|uniref:Uncharacterized protein n=1 Tax=Rhynchophorus ferrugineus TaxID=354439 RepID=A0A834M5B1_RHYFE|nr:hypothetical protein GWI33_016105 [Rhynchophorus ferrugineus]